MIARRGVVQPARDDPPDKDTTVMRILPIVLLALTLLAPPVLLAQTTQPRPPAVEPLDVLMGRPDTPGGGTKAAGDAGDDALLGETFESVAAGIKFRVPTGMKRAPRGTNPDQV